jgi:transposase
LVSFLIDAVDELDLGPIYREYTYRKGGQPAYHPKMMARLFVNVLKLCQNAGLVKFGHVSLDGTKA